MVWIKNLESLAERKTIGECPYCKSKDTDYTLIGEVGKIGFGVIWCNNCMNAYHISRIDIVDGYSTNKILPKGLKF